MEDKTNTRDQNEFNMAVSYLDRLNSLLNLCNAASTNYDACLWFKALLALHRELSTEMKEEEINEWENIRNKINELLNKQQRQYIRTHRSELSAELYTMLDKTERKLRIIMKESGLQARMKDNPTSNME